MPKPCEKADSQRGVFVETLSSDGQNAPSICVLSTRSDVRHFVRVRNLMAYPANIVCRGHISSDQRIIRFSSADSRDTTYSWTREKRNLAYSRSPYVFSNTPNILADVSNGSSEVVDLVVEVYWPQRDESRTMSLPITITA
jgi:hypothetical protein